MSVQFTGSDGTPIPAGITVDISYSGGDSGALTTDSTGTVPFDALNGVAYVAHFDEPGYPTAVDFTGNGGTTVVVANYAAGVVYTIVVTPSPDTLALGSTQKFTAMAHGDDGSVLPVAVTWATTAGTIDSNGVLTPDNKLGTFTVTATQAGPLPNQVNPTPPATGLAVTPATFDATGSTKTQKFTATITYVDSTTADVSNRVTWSVVNGLNAGYAGIVGTVDTDGNYDGTNAYDGDPNGHEAVLATYSKAGSVEFFEYATVDLAEDANDDPVADVLSISPASATLTNGQTQRFTAVLTSPDGTNTISTVSWRAGVGTKVDDSTDPQPLYTDYTAPASGTGTDVLIAYITYGPPTGQRDSFAGSVIVPITVTAAGG